MGMGKRIQVEVLPLVFDLAIDLLSCPSINHVHSFAWFAFWADIQLNRAHLYYI